MKKIKLALAHKSPSEKVAQGNAIKTAMTGNANFATPNPSLANVGTDTNDLQAKLVARNNAIEAAKAATEALHAAEEKYDATITQLAAYAENVTAGDPVKLESGGFELRANATPTTSLDQVENLRVETNGYPGRFKLVWNPLNNAKSYEVQLSPEPMTSDTFVTIRVSTGSRVTLDGLTSATKQWVRVRGVIADIAGQWSEPVGKIVP